MLHKTRNIPPRAALKTYLNRQPTGALLACLLFLQFCLQTGDQDTYFPRFPHSRQLNARENTKLRGSSLLEERQTNRGQSNEHNCVLY